MSLKDAKAEQFSQTAGPVLPEDMNGLRGFPAHPEQELSVIQRLLCHLAPTHCLAASSHPRPPLPSGINSAFYFLYLGCFVILGALQTLERLPSQAG